MEDVVWEMYQVFYSEGGVLEPGPRFRLLKDALAHVSRESDRSFAIRTPDGTWHRDADTGRAIFGRGGDAAPQAFEEEDTSPFGLGSGSFPTGDRGNN